MMINNKMMQRIMMMAVLMMGLFFNNTVSVIAQGKCPGTLEEEAWKACWLKEAKNGSKDLRQAALVNVDLKNIDLSNANLTGAQIVNSDLSGVNLSGATLTNVNVGGTNFTGANFIKAKITGVVFQGNNLTNADFTGAIFSKTAFSDTKIGGAKLDLKTLQCKVTTKGGNLDWEDSNGKVYGSLKNGTIVYRDFWAWDNGRINVSERRGDELVSVGLVDRKFVTCAKKTSKKTTKSKKI